MPDISPNAIVACPENLADDVVVGAFTYIGPDVRIGAGTRVDNHVNIEGQVEIGADCRIYPYAVIGQSADNGSATGSVSIGDRTRVREHSVICAGSEQGTRIGNDNLLMIGCYVGADATIEDFVVLGNYSQLAERTTLQTHVWAAAFTGAEPGVTVGRYTFTSGYAGIDRDAPPFAMLQGYPFRVRGVNGRNLLRNGYTDKQVCKLKDIFRSIFDNKGTPDVEAIEALAGRDDLGELPAFLIEYLREHDIRGADGEEGV